MCATQEQYIPPIPFCLVTGFLGSGKTTFLKRVLAQYADKMRIGIIQNEFAPGRVDGVELRQSGHDFQLMEINKGSVFCVCLLSDFRKSLQAFVDQIEPDVILLEATGLADPIAIGELLQAVELKARLYLAQVWCIVDAVHFLRMESSMIRVRHQIRIADKIIINKTDLPRADLAGCKTRIKKINPFGLQNQD
jgi:G3E family GTPase